MPEPEVGWLDLGPLDAFAQGGTRVEVGADRLAVFRLGEDLYVIGDRCSHAEASLAEGEVFDLEVECFKHGSSFDLRTGRPCTLPATVPVPVYETRVEDGRLAVREVKA